MIRVRLTVRDGVTHAADVDVPSDAIPDVVVWGTRVFVFNGTLRDGYSDAVINNIRAAGYGQERCAEARALGGVPCELREAMVL